MQNQLINEFKIGDIVTVIDIDNLLYQKLVNLYGIYRVIDIPDTYHISVNCSRPKFQFHKSRFRLATPTEILLYD